MILDNELFEDPNRELLIRPDDNKWEISMIIYGTDEVEDVTLEELIPMSLLQEGLDNLLAKYRRWKTGADGE